MVLRGSFSRSFLAAARAATSRSSPAVPRLRPPHFAGLRPSRRSFTSPPRLFRELGSAQSLLPLHSVVAGPCLTCHLSVNARACCELSQGT
ncbi:uncharacterized protein [Aristolochia californica]|uniref:uncharacterized protein n=1 Tax=Aristolochia californica TaxID=171875 RepID=UPI0035D9DFF9